MNSILFNLVGFDVIYLFKYFQEQVAPSVLSALCTTIKAQDILH